MSPRFAGTRYPVTDCYSAPGRLHPSHFGWATVLAIGLNKMLPKGYFARPSVEIGVEADVGALRKGDEAAGPSWQPPDPSLTVAVAAPADSAEVQVFDAHEGPVLVGVIELVSPSNKDRPAEREAFVDKCMAYLHRRIGLLIVDVVTERKANLHAALMNRLAVGTPEVSADELYAAAYRPRLLRPDLRVEARQEELSLGLPLPTLPLWLGPLCLRVDIEASYARACDDLMIPLNGVHAPSTTALF